MSTSITIAVAEGTILDIPSAGIERRGEVDISADHGFFKVDRYDGANTREHNFCKYHKLTGSGAKITGNTAGSDKRYFVDNADALGSVYHFSLKDNLQVFENYIRDNNSSTADIYASSGSIGSNSDLNINEAGPQVTTLAGSKLDTRRISGSRRTSIYAPYANNIKYNSQFITHIYIEDENYKGYNADGHKNSLFQVGDLVLYRDGYTDIDSNGEKQFHQYESGAKLPSQRWLKIEFDLVTGNRQVDSVSNVSINGLELENQVFTANTTNNIWYRATEYETDDLESVLRFTDAFILLREEIQSLSDAAIDEYYDIVKYYISPDNYAGVSNEAS